MSITPEATLADRDDRVPKSVDDVFGETVPRVSPDERDPRSRDDAIEHDRWIRENRPPHHA